MTLWIAFAAVAVSIWWASFLAAHDNRRHGKLDVRVSTQAVMDSLQSGPQAARTGQATDMMMRGYLKLLEFPDEVGWYDEQAQRAGFHVATQRGLRLYRPI